jgi:predicted nucleic acid-binding protein
VQSVIIDFIAARTNPEAIWLKRQVDQLPMSITTLTLSEVLQGFRYEAQAQKILDKLSCFSVLEIPNRDLALASAHNYRELRTLGFIVHSTIDCLIATFCIQVGHTVLHNDRDFDVFEAHFGLRVVHPPELSMN